MSRHLPLILTSLFFFFFFFFVVTSAVRLPSPATTTTTPFASSLDETSSRTYFYNQNHNSATDYNYVHSCGSFSSGTSRSLCIRLHGMNKNQRRHRFKPDDVPMPSSPPGDLDPRYGVEKRLVPSGPNPLHN